MPFFSLVFRGVVGRERLLLLGENSFKLRSGDGARHAVACRKEERGRARHVVAAGKRQVAAHHGSVAVGAHALGRNALSHPVGPGLRRILAADDLAVILFSPDHRRNKGVDRQVPDLFKNPLHRAAVGAVGVREDDHLARAVAEDLLHGILARPLVPAFARPLAQTFLRLIGLRLGVDDGARENVVHLVVDIKEPVLNEDFPEAGNRCRADAVGLEPRILHELVAHRLLIGLGGTGKKREGGKGRSGKLLE